MKKVEQPRGRFHKIAGRAEVHVARDGSEANQILARLRELGVEPN